MMLSRPAGDNLPDQKLSWMTRFPSQVYRMIIKSPGTDQIAAYERSGCNEQRLMAGEGVIEMKHEGHTPVCQPHRNGHT